MRCVNLQGTVKYYNSEVSGIILHCGYKDHSTK